MLEWRTPILSDLEWVSDIVNKSRYIGSDVAFANIFLLREKYKIKLAEKEGYLIRYYEGAKNRTGYTFPLGNYTYGLNKVIARILSLIEEDSQITGRSLEYTLVSEEQLRLLRKYYGDRLEITHDLGDEDYIYNQSELASLSGRKFHKKKNHVSRFIKEFNDISSVNITEENLVDVQIIEDRWMKVTEKTESALYEYRAIEEALENFEKLELKGTITYVNSVPAAMTIYSHINDNCVDIHFEKSYGDYAELGAFAYINQENAKKIKAETINREEDINIEGLRKAKQSYHPSKKIIKYHVKVK